MSAHSLEFLQSAFASQPLFEDKTWRISPEPWPLSEAQVSELEAIGQACYEFYRALDNLYARSWQGKNLLRNRVLVAPWVADYLDRGKPKRLIEHGRNPALKGQVPLVIRPDLLITEEGFTLTEMDSVPGGIGLTAFLNRLYAQPDGKIVGGETSMPMDFYDTLRALAPDVENPCIAIVVSDEASTYRPEFEYLSGLLREQGLRVYVCHPDEIMPLGRTLCVPADGNPEKIDIIYRFWELFDLGNLSTADRILEAVEAGEVKVSPPMKAYQEEKINLALLHHHMLEDYWKENLSRRSFRLLKKIIPQSWVVDPVELPPNAVLDAPYAQGKPIRKWEELGEASQKERNLILKVSGFHETAWGARSVTLGSDTSKTEWQAAIQQAVAMAGENLHVLQNYHKPSRLTHPVYDSEGKPYPMEGRTRLCPFYFVRGDAVMLSGVLATFCPADKKIIHGMRDAALLPCRAV